MSGRFPGTDDAADIVVDRRRHDEEDDAAIDAEALNSFFVVVELVVQKSRFYEDHQAPARPP